MGGERGVPVVVPEGRPSGSPSLWWIRGLRLAAIAVFAAIPPLGMLMQPHAGRVVWTIVVAALPLFIVLVGYHRWRLVCPLAFVNQIPVMLRLPGSRRASAWLEVNHPYVSFSVFFVALWLRLIATNGDGPVIASFFILIAAAALLYGVLYRGKTWCNYVCPLQFIEKIYTEPRGLRATANSQCSKCTACKLACPDIDEENAYWNEIQTRPKRFVYHAFPGLVFAFYFYYYLQSGTWDYYFSGRWTDEPGVLWTAFSPGSGGSTAGFFFWPSLPRAAAAASTLAALSLSSVLVFSWLEGLVGWILGRRSETSAAHIRSVSFALASFAAFVTFYSFAGQPTLRTIPGAPQIVGVVVVAVATLSLARRIKRTKRDFTEATLARGILKRWEWPMDRPRDEQEAYLIHDLLTRSRRESYAKLVEVYRETVHDVVADRLLAREDVAGLESLRNRLGIKPADHLRIMAELALEERAALADPASRPTAEKRLQLKTYEEVLARHLKTPLAGAGTQVARFVRQLHREYGVSTTEHEAILQRLLAGTTETGARFKERLSQIAYDAQTGRLVETEPSPAAGFLADLLRRGTEQALRRLMIGLSDSPGDEAIQAVLDAIGLPDEGQADAAISNLRAHVSPRLADLVIEARWRSARGGEGEPRLAPASVQDRLAGLTESPDPLVRAATLHLLARMGEDGTARIHRLETDESHIVRETARTLRAATQAREGGGASPVGLTHIDKMIALRRVPSFATLAPEDLSDLTIHSREIGFAPGTALCLEGEPSQDVFVLLEGNVTVLRGVGAQEIILATASAGSVLGEMAVLNQAPRTATVRAGQKGARALVLDGDSFRRSLHDDPAIADAVIRTLALRLSGADNVIQSAAASTPPDPVRPPSL